MRKFIFTFVSALALCVVGCGEEEGTETPEPPQEEEMPSFEPPEEETPEGGSGGN